MGVLSVVAPASTKPEDTKSSAKRDAATKKPAATAKPARDTKKSSGRSSSSTKVDGQQEAVDGDVGPAGPPVTAWICSRRKVVLDRCCD